VDRGLGARSMRTSYSGYGGELEKLSRNLGNLNQKRLRKYKP